ncbi:uncharacterized protein J3R85_020645 [Psidium guajava]|nr:uncharacterized protein J3R85_020645 [Psidium guajava]
MSSTSDHNLIDRDRKTRSVVWEHFQRIPCANKGQEKAECVYCGAIIGCSSSQGTSSMHHHLARCKGYPYAKVEKRQKVASSQLVGIGSSSSPWKFDQNASKKELAIMFILGELPFKFVEHAAFQRFVNKLQPKFLIPSHDALRHDCYELYVEERNKLKKYFSDTSPRVCLTTDTWTSCQNLSYICLTAHFVDADWKLQKKILNFCQIPGHSSEIIGKAVEKCLTSWEIQKVFSMTMDNASSNDLGIQYLKKKLISWNSLVLRGELLHMRCCAHILSLIAREGLKDIDDSVVRIRSAVQYVRSSPARLERFKSCIEQENIESKSLVYLDVETRWNSTYMMLEAALKLQKAFGLLEIQDGKFVKELSKAKGLPTNDDWEYARQFLPFLKLFFDTTLTISGSSYVTSNDMVKHVYGVYMMIDAYCENQDKRLQEMAKRMKIKFNKYFGNVNNVNLSLFIACILDPRHKWEYVKWLISDVYKSKQAETLRDKVRTSLTSLFEQYRTGVCAEDNLRLKSVGTISVSKFPIVDADILTAKYLKQTGQQYLEEKSELDKYLEEECERYSPDFDILSWWKVNASRYPILSSIARDVLAVPVSTVALEGTFSTVGCVLDVFRSSLTPSMVEALICAQDWLRSTPLSLSIEEDLEELENFESELSTMTMEPNSMLVSLDD